MASRWWGLLLVLLMAGFCGVSTFMLLELRRNAFSSATQSAENLVAATSQDIIRNVELYDLSLQAVCDGVTNASVVALPPALRNDVLFDRAATARHFGAITVLDPQGNLVFSSALLQPGRENLAARDYFVHHRDHPHVGLLVTGPDRMPDGDLVLTLSRGITRPDGSFGGVAVGTLSLGYFRDLFGRFRFSAGSAINLFRDDGTLVARSPRDDDAVGRSIRNGETFRRFSASPRGRFVARSALDGRLRVYTFSHLGTLPLILDVAIAWQGIYAAWYREAVATGMAVALLCLAGTLLGVLLSRELRRRAAAERLTRDSEAQYRLLADNCTDIIMRVDHNLVRTYVSPASRALLGYAPEAMVGGRNRDIVHPDDHPSLVERVREAQRIRQPLESAYRVRRRSGDYVWVEGRYSFVPADGGFIIVMRDVSRRKAAEHELDRAHAELARLATIDGLTQLANRRCLDARLEQEWRRAAQEGTPLSLVLLDVDHFKRFNDRYGHPAGDTCLRAVARAVACRVRQPRDLAARYGGEELAVVLPGLHGASLLALAERLRAGVEALAIPHEGNEGGVVTVSIGAATANPVGRDPGDGTALLALADAALYAAKRAGRNRVVADGPPTPPPAAGEGRAPVRTGDGDDGVPSRPPASDGADHAGDAVPALRML